MYLDKRQLTQYKGFLIVDRTVYNPYYVVYAPNPHQKPTRGRLSQLSQVRGLPQHHYTLDEVKKILDDDLENNPNYRDHDQKARV